MSPASQPRSRERGRDQTFKLSSCYCHKRQSDIPPGPVQSFHLSPEGIPLQKKQPLPSFSSPEWASGRTCLPANIVSRVPILLHYCLYSVVVLCFRSFAILPKLLRAAEFSLLSGSFVRALYRRQAFRDVAMGPSIKHIRIDGRRGGTDKR